MHKHECQLSTLCRHHSTGGNKEDGTYPALNDRGFDWWKSRLVIEDPEYCAKVAFTVGSWIELLDKYKPE